MTFIKPVCVYLCSSVANISYRSPREVKSRSYLMKIFSTSGTTSVKRINSKPP